MTQEERVARINALAAKARAEGLTQEELAERIDRSTQFISTIERGLAGPSLETVLHLCEVLGTSTEWILRGRAPLSESNLTSTGF